jgi:uracil-DNA glycosylase
VRWNPGASVPLRSRPTALGEARSALPADVAYRQRAEIPGPRRSQPRFPVLRPVFVVGLLSLLCACGSQSPESDAPLLEPAFGKADGTGQVDAVVALGFDAPEASEFVSDGAFDGYAFQARPGSTIRLEVTQRGSSRGLDTSLFLFAQDDTDAWEEVGRDDESGWGQLSRLDKFQLPVWSSRFRAVVGTADGKGRGRYRLLLTCQAGECALPALDVAAGVPEDWADALEEELAADSIPELGSFLWAQYATETVYPPQADIYRALELTPVKDVKVVILGQDPYHGAGQAHGLSFSVPDGVAIPPSLRNMFKELETDLGIAPPTHGNLTPWASSGVLLLNTSLTVREHEPASHAGRGWEELTDGMIEALDDREEHVVFLLWGGHARRKARSIDTERHTVIECAHPSPLSARRGFFGCQPFSRANAALEAAGQGPVDWSLPQ